jgi:DNA repair protein RecO (recombination protein O)
MEWNDEGVVLAVRKHGETSAIVELLTAEHGRCAGLVRGGRGKRLRPVLQPGNLLQVTWRARLEDHLGTYQLEPLALHAGTIFENRFRLAGLVSLTSLAQMLPEREPHPRLYQASRIILDSFDDDAVWPALLVRWEMGLLDELGFGLDLSKCAATGLADDLVFVSPKSGKAVSRAAGLPYAEKLFALPSFLRGEAGLALGDVLSGLKLTGYFLERHVLGPRQIAMPPQRQWLQDDLQSRAVAA